MLTGEQIRAARALLHWEQKDLAAESRVSLPTVQRLDAQYGEAKANAVMIDAITRTLETAGVEFIDRNGGGPGVRLKE